MYDPDRRYYVYILASKSRVLYIGITRHLAVRIAGARVPQVRAFLRR
jgi:predicted GIY-YIG superfamily endonuclease